MIDPVLVYSSYLGGSSISQINAMAVNAAGDIYVTGATEAINLNSEVRSPFASA